MTVYAFEGEEVTFEDLFIDDTKIWSWRKANQIHGWFVKNIQDEKDDCGLYYISESQVKELLDLVNYTLTTKDTTKLPPVRGFFFGTGIDEWYWKNLEDTKKYLTEMIHHKNKNPQTKFYYHSSW